MAYQAGNAFVGISPDMSTFQDDTKAELTKALPLFTQFGTDAGKAFASSFQDELKTAFADLPDATVKATADTATLDADLDAATKSRTATVNADADTTAAVAKLDAAAKTRTVTFKAVADNSAVSKVDELLSPAVLAGAGLATALGPTAAAAAFAVGGIGVAFGAAAATAGAFGAVAVPMFTAVTTAQKALTTAQAAYDKATTPAARTAALAAEQAALAKLTPAEKDLLTQVNALEGGWKKLTQAEQPVVESALTPWLQTATSSMGLLTPLIEDGAGAIHLLGTEAQTALQSPFWGTFSNTLGTTGQIALTNFGAAAGSVGDGLAHLFVTFAPDIDKLLTDIPTLAGYFDTWAKSVTSGGLENFFATTFSHANLQALGGDLKDLGSFLTNAATASGQMSGTAFAGLTNVLDVLGRLTPTEIEALTGLFLAIKAISAVSSGINAVSSFLTNAQKAAGKVTGLFGTTADAAAEGTASGKAAGAAASAAWKESFDPWAASLEDETGAESAGEAAGIAFTAAFTEAIEAGMPKSLLAIEAAEAPEAKALGAGLGAEAGASFSTETAAEREAAGTTVVPGSVVKEGEEGTAEKSAAKGTDAKGILGSLGTVAIAATALQTGASALSAQAAKPGTAQGKAASNIQHANTQVTGLPTGTDPASIATGFEGFATVEAPKLWSEIYEGFESNVGSPIAAWFTQSLPNAFTSAIPRLIWSPAYQGFETEIGSPIASWFTSTLPSFFSGAGSWLASAGGSVASGFVTGWNATSGAVATAFGAAKTWVSGAFSASVSWLTGAGGDVSSGFRTAWTATSGAVSTAFAAAKTWVSSQFTSAASWLSAAGGDVSSGFSKAWNATSATVSSDFAKAKTWVTGQFSSAGSWLATAGTDTSSGFTKAWNATSATVSSDAAKAKTWVTSQFTDAKNWLTSSGSDAGQGFLNGLESKSGSIISEAESIGNSVINTIAKALASASPSKKTMELGAFAGQGLGLGMLSTQGYVEDSANTLAQTGLGALSSLGQANSLQSLAALGVPSISTGGKLPGVTSPLSTGPLQLQLSYAGSGNQLTDALVGALRADIQGAGGGDVQAHLGRGFVRLPQ